MFKFSLNFYGVYRLFRLKYLKKQRVRFCPKMSNEVKLRKKSHSAKSSNLSESPKANGEEKERRSGGRLEAEEVGKERSSGVRLAEPSGSSLLDLRTCLCVLTLAVCGALAWVVLQQNERFSDLENKYTLLHQRTTGLLTLEEEVLRVSEKCQGVQEALAGPGSGSLGPQLEALQREAGQLGSWAGGRSQQLQSSVAAVTGAVERIEERTGAVTTEVNNKVASVKTDVRRMEGLRSELEALLAQLGALEEQALQAERTMVTRIADLLSASIDRVSALRAVAEDNARAVGELQRRLPAIAAADGRTAERLRELEAGRARLVRTVTFAGDLKPKVAGIQRDFAAFEPRLSDLTLRIGQLAEDLAKREREVEELRGALTPLSLCQQGEELASLTPGQQGALDSEDVPDGEDIGLRLQGLLNHALLQTELGDQGEQSEL
ncbi:inhibitor of nuclear factor kappa-B kinase-interacting protein isoform X2 [Gadus macrocephalus]|uniref:inhibitor of nuclear factor kappa-B kinase-interacting protein isoform X2 n=1 Tax=Gadus macrocephalus TaxID=80720 RepID=UPI0028CB7FF6|nr:inhibitor of nuclear factor kappa-B kinase-interacting protein isoform X2 [Gadus macrocephalus]